MSLNLLDFEGVKNCSSDIDYFSFKFTDHHGVLKEIFFPKRVFIENFNNCKTINIGKGVSIIPDWKTSFFEPFTSRSILSVFCSIANNVCTRSIAKKALERIDLIVDSITARFDFYIFDNAKYCSNSHSGLCEIDTEESPNNFRKHYEYGNIAHRRNESLNFSSQPVDTLSEIRSEISNVLQRLDIKVICHAHSNCPGQCYFVLDIGKNPDTLQLFKYVVKNVASSFGKTATFMPNIDSMKTPNFIDYSFFFNEKKYPPNEIAKDFFKGLRFNLPALLALTNSSVNSYRFEKLKNALDFFIKTNGELSDSFFGSKCFSVGFADPSSNLYISLAAIIAAAICEVDENSSYTEEKYFVDRFSFMESIFLLKDKKTPILQTDIFDEKSLNSLLDSYEAMALKKDSLPITDFENFYSC